MGTASAADFNRRRRRQYHAHATATAANAIGRAARSIGGDVVVASQKVGYFSARDGP